MAPWMKSNRLSLNPSKADFLWRPTESQHGVISSSRCINTPSTSVRDLSVVLDWELSLRLHVNWLVGQCFQQLSQNKSFVKALPFKAAKSAVNGFVVSRLDYCNSLLTGVPMHRISRLQSVLKAAVKLLCRRYDHVPLILRCRLLWPPV